MAGTQAQQVLATQYSEIPSNASVRVNPAVVAASPVLRAAAHSQLVSRPAGTPDYQRVTSAIHGNIYDALPGPGSTGVAPCLALVRAARAINPRVHVTLRCGPGATGGG